MLHAKFQGNWPSGSGEEDFLRFWAWRPSWSCDLDHLYKLLFPPPKEAPHKIWLWLVKRFQRRRRLKMWTDGRRRRTTTDAGPWVYYKLTLWAWRLRWAKNKILHKIVSSLAWKTHPASLKSFAFKVSELGSDICFSEMMWTCLVMLSPYMLHVPSMQKRTRWYSCHCYHLGPEQHNCI